MQTRVANNRYPCRNIWRSACVAIGATLLWTCQTQTAGVSPGPLGSSFVDDLSKLNPAFWYIGDFAFPDEWNDTAWSPNAVRLKPEGLTVTLRPRRSQGKSFVSGMIQTRAVYHYGRYEVVMQPARGSGLVTGFFTYTGPYFGTRQDEIDFEFLGKSTRSVQLNFWRGASMLGLSVPLGVDAAERPRIYAFEWLPDSIRWFIDDRLLHEVTGPASDLPDTPGKIYLSLWAVGPSFYAWAGPANIPGPVTARFLCVSFQAYGENTPACSDRYMDK